MSQDFAYSDIVGLPHHVSDRRPRMLRKNRAAQFAPFAALTGYEAEIREAARTTQNRRVLTEDERENLAQKIAVLSRCAPTTQAVEFTWFVPDLKKCGGEYQTAADAVAYVSERLRQILLADGTCIPIDAVDRIESALFFDWDGYEDSNPV